MDLLTANDRLGQHAPSYYAATANPHPERPALLGETTADVCVIGAGFTGLSTALHLAEKGFSVVLLDAHRVGWGASGRNGGQIATGPRVAMRHLEAEVGPSRAAELWRIALDAKVVLRDRVARHAIACDLKAGAVHGEVTKAGARHAHEEAAHLAERYGYGHITPLDRKEIRIETGSDYYAGGYFDADAGHLHPLNYALGLARAAMSAGVQIFETSPVRRITDTTPQRIETPQGHVLAEHIVFATNGYTGDLAPPIGERVMPINNFIAATEPLGPDRARAMIPSDGCVADSQFVVNYYRFSADNRMLFGGGETYSYRFPRDIAGLVRARMAAVYPALRDVRIDYAWGGTLGITLRRMPYFARLGPRRIVAAGYSGQGVAMTSVAGRLVAEAVAGEAGGFDTMAALRHTRFPGGGRLRHPLLVLAMSWYALRARLGF